MKHLLLLVITYGALVAQTTLASQMAIHEIAPYWPLVALIAAFGLCEGRTLLVWSAIIGLGCDALGTGPLGRELLVLTAVALVFGSILTPRASRSPMFKFVSGFMVATAALFLSSALELALNHREIAVTDLLRGIAGCAAYTALLAAIGRALWNATWRICFSPFAALRPLKA